MQKIRTIHTIRVSMLLYCFKSANKHTFIAIFYWRIIVEHKFNLLTGFLRWCTYLSLFGQLIQVIRQIIVPHIQTKRCLLQFNWVLSTLQIHCMTCIEFIIWILYTSYNVNSKISGDNLQIDKKVCLNNFRI